MKNILILLLFVCTSLSAQKQYSNRPGSNEIYQQIEKLNFLGSVLYIAAHPDDENTRLLAYLSKELNANTAYLSMTRGDGGQNLIGTEIREELGLLRTYELLEARATDGGKQFFTRANDFGYSKHPDETFEIWNKKEVLSDIVKVIRKFKPDIIVNRFDHRTPGKTHGHHTGSAILSLEANKMAADPTSYPEQLKELDTWQTTRLFMNTSWWFYGSREKFAEVDKSNLCSVDIGKYAPILGSSISEIATRARSKHLSQGFGSTPKRGSYSEWLEFIDGVKPNSQSDIFEGINTTWSRLEGGEKIGKGIDAIIETYDFKNPAASIPALLEVYAQIMDLSDSHWKSVKLEEIKSIIEMASGLYLEAISEEQMISYGDSIELNIEATNRSDVAMQLNSLTIEPLDLSINDPHELENNVENRFYRTVKISEDFSLTAPYWLEQKGSLGMYHVENKDLIGLPYDPNRLSVTYNMEIGGVPINFTKKVIHKYSDPAKGEVYRPFEVVEPIYVSLDKEVYLFADEYDQEVSVNVKSMTNQVSGKLSLDLPTGWSSKPSFQEFTIEQKNGSQDFVFIVTPINSQFTGSIAAKVESDNKVYTRSIKHIEYDHVPHLTMSSPAEAKLVRIPMKRNVDKIAYINGAGDKMPESLRNVGYDLDILEIENLNNSKLLEYDAVILGVRIYNVNTKIALYQKILFDYVKQGGTLINQYNTSRRLKADSLAPYHLKLSRDRVTDEFAKVRLLAPDHPVLNFPNKITDNDFEDWVQERGLYFPNEWGPEFTPILSANDKGEEPKDGGLLIAKHGKGHFVYSGISWFRELPAGVAGAYRLFANVIALGKADEN